MNFLRIFIPLGSVFSSEPIESNENNAGSYGLDSTSVKPKKTVTINDFRRTNSDSPDFLKTGKASFLS